MRILITGATGFVGSHLALRLLGEGHQVVAATRDIASGRERLGAGVEFVRVDDDRDLGEAVDGADAIVNLAGAPIATRWTARRWEAIRSSRIDTTRRLVEAIGRARTRPRVLVSASAIGVYGSRGDDWVDSTSEPARGDLAQLCLDWEERAGAATDLGVRVVLARFGIVLGAEGGALAQMMPAFRWGFGATLGRGDQWMSWIHLDDALEFLVRAVHGPDYRGTYDVVAPSPVTNRRFTEALSAAVGPRARLRVPASVLRLGFGGAAAVMLSSQRVAPRRLLDSGFAYRFPALEDALADLTSSPGLAIERLADAGLGMEPVVPAEAYLEQRRPTHLLEQCTRIDAPVSEVFAFFSRAENLGPMTPPTLAFRIMTPTPVQMKPGAQIDYRIGLGPIPLGWKTEIVHWERERRFTDAQLRGPYRCWYHEHRFEPDGDGTVMRDRVWYAAPFGSVGRLANRQFVMPMLRRIFDYRRRAIALRFPDRTRRAGRPAPVAHTG